MEDDFLDGSGSPQSLLLDTLNRVGFTDEDFIVLARAVEARALRGGYIDLTFSPTKDTFEIHEGQEPTIAERRLIESLREIGTSEPDIVLLADMFGIFPSSKIRYHKFTCSSQKDGYGESKQAFVSFGALDTLFDQKHRAKRANMSYTIFDAMLRLDEGARVTIEKVSDDVFLINGEPASETTDSQTDDDPAD